VEPSQNCCMPCRLLQPQTPPWCEQQPRRASITWAAGRSSCCSSQFRMAGAGSVSSSFGVDRSCGCSPAIDPDKRASTTVTTSILSISTPGREGTAGSRSPGPHGYHLHGPPSLVWYSPVAHIVQRLGRVKVSAGRIHAPGAARSSRLMTGMSASRSDQSGATRNYSPARG
jgi:hypothetical protein